MERGQFSELYPFVYIALFTFQVLEPIFCCFLSKKIIKLLKKILSVKIHINWKSMQTELKNNFGDNLMLTTKKVQYSYVKKLIRKVRMKINITKIILLMMALIRFAIPFILDHFFYLNSDLDTIIYLNFISCFIYFVYFIVFICMDRKINGDIISQKRNIKENVFNNYIKTDYIN